MTEAEWKEFLEELPPHVRAVAERYPMTTPCYRSTEDPEFHYKIYSYDGHRQAPGIPVTVTLVHGRDSANPGIKTGRQPPEQLIPCNCGKWLPPTREQIEAKGQEIAAHHARRRGH